MENGNQKPRQQHSSPGQRHLAHIPADPIGQPGNADPDERNTQHCADEGEYENCWSSTDSETDYWNVGEAILIDTSCTSVCTVAISILNSFEGVTLDTVMVDLE